MRNRGRRLGERREQGRPNLRSFSPSSSYLPLGESTPQHCCRDKHPPIPVFSQVCSFGMALGPSLFPASSVGRPAHKLSSCSPLSEIHGLHPKPVMRKGAGTPRPRLPSFISLAGTSSSRLPVGGGEFPDYQVKKFLPPPPAQAREVVTSRYQAGAPGSQSTPHPQRRYTHTHVRTRTGRAHRRRSG